MINVGPDGRCDVIVIGAGIAGLTAARRAQQLGATVVVVDKGGANDANNTRRSGGAFHAANYDPRRHTPDEMYEMIQRVTDGHARPDVARSWAENVLRALLFLESEGGVFDKVGNAEYTWNRNGPPPVVVEEFDIKEPRWRGAANDRLLTRLTNAFVDSGGTYRNETRAVALEMENGAVVGVQVEPRSGGPREIIRGRAAIMADGGFGANPELMRKYVTQHSYCVLCSDLETGDSLQMAMAIGAKAVELDACYQWVVLRDRLTNPRFQHPPSPTWVINAAMVVDGNGERFIDEAQQTPPSSQDPHGYPHNQWSDKRMSGALTKSAAPGDAWIIFDETVWQTAGRKTAAVDATMPEYSHPMRTPVNPVIVDNGGTFLSADSIAELARQAGLPADRLQTSVDAFNRYCRTGAAIEPPRTGRPQPVARPPFHAIPLIPGIFFTMGGVLVNGNGQALDEQERPIPGLYAAGGAMGGLMGGPRQGYAGGWAEASTFGMLAAEHAVASVGSQAVAAR
jgi:fumarate reductase flavoprotein subunit